MYLKCVSDCHYWPDYTYISFLLRQWISSGYCYNSLFTGDDNWHCRRVIPSYTLCSRRTPATHLEKKSDTSLITVRITVWMLIEAFDNTHVLSAGVNQCFATADGRCKLPPIRCSPLFCLDPTAKFYAMSRAILRTRRRMKGSRHTPPV